MVAKRTPPKRANRERDMAFFPAHRKACNAFFLDVLIRYAAWGAVDIQK
jgi:hypothetical protein